MDLEELYEPNYSSSTPNFILPKLIPCKQREPLQMSTTPLLHPILSIPFQWEEAPGKPRPTLEAAAPPPLPLINNKVAIRCLDLPPRMFNNNDDAKITIIPSSSTVLDGPYVGRSLSLACTFSLRKRPVTGWEDKLIRPTKKSGDRNLGSWRLGSFKEEGTFDRGSFDFSHSLDDHDVFKSEKKNVKITRVGKKRSFFSFSSMSSNLWGDIYSSLKKAVPWTWRRT